LLIQDVLEEQESDAETERRVATAVLDFFRSLASHPPGNVGEAIATTERLWQSFRDEVGSNPRLPYVIERIKQSAIAARPPRSDCSLDEEIERLIEAIDSTGVFLEVTDAESVAAILVRLPRVIRRAKLAAAWREGKRARQLAVFLVQAMEAFVLLFSIVARGRVAEESVKHGCRNLATNGYYALAELCAEVDSEIRERLK